MKNRLPLFILCAWGGIILGSQEIEASQNLSFLSNRCLPQIAYSFDDIDPRDANNRPVAADSAREDLKEIFSSGLFALLTRADIYSIVQSVSVIRKKVNLSACSLSGSLPSVVERFVAAIAPTKKKWDKLLVCLPGFLALNLPIIAFLFFSPKLSLTVIQKAPVTLRC